RPEVPRWLAAVVERALAPATRDRFPDGLALEQALASAGRAAPNRWVAPIVAGVVLLGLVAIVLVLAAKGATPVPKPTTPAVPPPEPHAAPPVASEPKLPPGLRLAGRKVQAADGKQ